MQPMSGLLQLLLQRNFRIEKLALVIILTDLIILCRNNKQNYYIYNQGCILIKVGYLF
jgi:hypothetical protein